MLTAMSTGHVGSLSTLHAPTPADALRRLQLLATMGEADLPYAAVADQVAAAIDLVVHQARLADGRRRVTAVCALGDRGDAPLVDLARWHEDGAGGELRLTPALAHAADRLGVR